MGAHLGAYFSLRLGAYTQCFSVPLLAPMKDFNEDHWGPMRQKNHLVAVFVCGCGESIRASGRRGACHGAKRELESGVVEAGIVRRDSRTWPVGAGRHNGRFRHGTLRSIDEDRGEHLPAGSLRFSSLNGELAATVSLKQLAAGSWHVCRCQIALFSDLQLGSAIRLAMEMARDERQRLRHQVCVKIPGPSSTIVLARYADGYGTHVADTMAA